MSLKTASRRILAVTAATALLGAGLLYGQLSTSAIAEEEASGGIVLSEPLKLGNSVGYSSEGGYIANIAELPGMITHAERDAENAEANQPAIYMDSNGFLVQPVPSDPTGWNITYLNADQRGCNSCHNLGRR